jgi:glycosyltransferase involved in cell wall biosynthesis
MKVLIFTQVMDVNDPVLGFFHRWIAEFSIRFDEIIVICLKEGEHHLPRNVRIFSLGKEKGLSRLEYVMRFYTYIFKFRNEYDSVFVHMNQEYVLLGGIFWKFLKKNVYMWRNHHAGTMLTDVAALFCKKVFCTSKFSYTTKYKKTVLMPVGIDTETFKKIDVPKRSRSILFLARIAPIKKPNVLIYALGILKKAGQGFFASFYGDPLPADKAYNDSLRVSVRNAGVVDDVAFFPGVANSKTPEIYNAHDVFVNLSTSGMYDKTIFEAMACETLMIASNENLRGLVDDKFIFKEGDVEELSKKLEFLLNLPRQEKEALGRKLRLIVKSEHSLEKLAQKLIVSMQ